MQGTFNLEVYIQRANEFEGGKGLSANPNP